MDTYLSGSFQRLTTFVTLAVVFGSIIILGYRSRVFHQKGLVTEFNILRQYCDDGGKSNHTPIKYC